MTGSENDITKELSKILTIINPKYSSDLINLQSLEKELKRALKDNASREYTEKLTLDINTISEALKAQTEAAKKFYENMVTASGGVKEFDVKTLNETLKPIINYSKKLNQIEELEKRRDLILEAADGNPLSQDSLDELKKIKDEIRKLAREARDIKTKADSKKGMPKALYRVIEGEGGERFEPIRSGIVNVDNGRESNYDRAYRSKLRIENEEELIKMRNTWNLVKTMWARISADAKKAGNVWLDFNAQAVSDAKRLGMTTKGEVMSYTETLIEKTQELSRNFGMSRAEAMKMQEAYAKTTGRATLLTTEQMSDIAAASKIMGQETVQSAIAMLDNMGSTSQTAVELLDSTYARAKNAGLDINKTSEILVKNLSLANRFAFRDGLDSLSRMAVYSQKIRMDLSEIGNVAEKVSTIEGSIETAARLQVLGGAGAMLGSNPMQLLYEGVADQEALFERISKIFGAEATFNRRTGRAEISPYMTEIIREQAKAVNMNPDVAIQTSRRQATIKEIESDLMKSSPVLFQKLTEEQKDALYNKAEFDKERQSFFVNYRNERGEEQKKYIQNISELTENEWKSITDTIEPVEDIRENVRKIASELVGTRERWNSMKEQIWGGVAKAIHPIMEMGDSVLNFVNSSRLWQLLTTTAVGGFGIMAGRFAWGLSKFYLSSLVGKIGKEIIPKINVASDTSVVSGAKEVTTGATRGSQAFRMSRIGGAATVVGAAIAGGLKWHELNTRANEKLKTSEKAISLIESQNNTIKSTLNDYTRSYTSRQVEIMRRQAQNRASEEKAGAIGAGVGTFGGVLAGAATGAMVGSMIPIPGVGTLAGAIIGGIGGYLGGKYGKEFGRSFASTDDGDIINKHLSEINKSDTEDNFRKIVLPIESIDYNVSLIANRLGIQSAMPAVGNVYLEAEAVEAGVEQERIMQQTITPVNERYGVEFMNAPYSQSYGNNSSIDLNVNGSINLNMDKTNVGKLTQNDLKEIFKKPEFRNYIVELVSEGLSQKFNNGRVSHNPQYKVTGFASNGGSSNNIQGE